MGNKKIVVAVDFGHAETNATAREWDEDLGVEQGSSYPTVTNSSLVGWGHAEMRLEMNGSNGKNKPDQITLGEKRYLAGPNVDIFTKRFTKRQDASRFLEGDELLVNFYHALSKLGLGHENERLSIGTAFPISFFLNDPGKTRQSMYINGVTKRLMGAHKFTVNGVSHSVMVEDVYANLTQPLCALFSLNRNPFGQSLADSPFAMENELLVLDGGGSTLDTYGAKDKQINQTLCLGKPIGLNRAGEELQTTLEAALNVEVSLLETERLMRAYVDGKPVMTSVFGDAVDVRLLVEQQVQAYRAQVFDVILPLIREQASRCKILVVGGIAYYIRERMLAEFPRPGHVYFPPEPNLAVVQGMLNALVSHYKTKARNGTQKTR